MPPCRVALLLAVLLPTASACLADVPTDEGPSDAEDDSLLPGGKTDTLLSVAEVAGILAVANTADLQTLDDDVALDVRAAEHMIEHRNGADGQPSTPDDNTFDSLAELDSVKWVGKRAFEKLRAFAKANGYIDQPGATDCLIISEYVESWGQYNKAVELFNCGSTAISLSEYSICMVRNSDADCTVTSDLGTDTLTPGQVTTVCRRKGFHPASLDPIPTLAQACDLERPGVMTFSGNDRLLLLDDSGEVADALGRVGYQPAPDTWANMVLDRCNFAPADGVSFYDHLDYFTVRSSGHIQNYGLPPVAGCP